MVKRGYLNTSIQIELVSMNNKSVTTKAVVSANNALNNTKKRIIELIKTEGGGRPEAWKETSKQVKHIEIGKNEIIGYAEKNGMTMDKKTLNQFFGFHNSYQFDLAENMAKKKFSDRSMPSEGLRKLN